MLLYHLLCQMALKGRKELNFTLGRIIFDDHDIATLDQLDFRNELLIRCPAILSPQSGKSQWPNPLTS